MTKSWLFNIVFLFIFFGCSTAKYILPDKHKTQELNYYAKCRIQIELGNKKYSSFCSMQLTNMSWQLIVYDPFLNPAFLIYIDQLNFYARDFINDKTNFNSNFDRSIPFTFNVAQIQQILYGTFNEQPPTLFDGLLQKKWFINDYEIAISNFKPVATFSVPYYILVTGNNNKTIIVITEITFPEHLEIKTPY